MIKCPFCHMNHVPNTIFCDECGNYLLKDEDRQTDPLDQAENWNDGLEWVDGTAEGEDVASVLMRSNIPQAIRLHIDDKNRDIEISLERVVLLGRLDPGTNVFPDIDLSQIGSFSKGISRRHAQIIKIEDRIVIEDLASINGTFVNGKRLTPYVPERLSDGDTLNLGNLTIRVQIPG